MIPLLGQGKPLPSDCSYDGVWLLENVLFLFRPMDAASSSPRFTPGIRRLDGEWCTGFDAAILARGLGLGIDELFAANQQGTLGLAAVEDAASAFGGQAAKRYVFALGNKISMLTIEAPQPGGSG